MRLVRDVRVCEYTFAYTRTSSLPIVTRDKAGLAEMPVRLRLFDKVAVGDRALHPVLCLVQSEEGFYVRLDETCVLEWLENGIRPAPAEAGVRLGGRLIEEFARMNGDEDVRFSRFLDEYRRERNVPRLASGPERACKITPDRGLPRRALPTLGRRIYPAATVIFRCTKVPKAHCNTMGKNELPWVIRYLSALTGLFWLGRMVGAHVHLVHVV
jgi:hypothetical protein